MNERLRAALEDVTSRTARAAIDRRLLDGLTRDERREASAALLARAAATDDPRVPDALVALGDAEGAHALARTGPWNRTRAAALQRWWTDTADPAARPLWLEATRAADPWVRALAVEHVRHLPGDDATLALLGAVEVGGVLGGAHAATALLARLGLDTYGAAPSPVATIALRASSPLRSVRAAAHRQLHDLVAGLATGAAQDALYERSLDPRAVERVRASVMAQASPLPEIDVDALITLRGADRRWATELLLGRLATADARLPAALAWLGGPVVHAALTEVDFGPKSFRDAVANALDALGVTR